MSTFHAGEARQARGCFPHLVPPAVSGVSYDKLQRQARISDMEPGRVLRIDNEVAYSFVDSLSLDLFPGLVCSRDCIVLSIVIDALFRLKVRLSGCFCIDLSTVYPLVGLNKVRFKSCF